ncbi:MAG: winged helix-turn-helix domain-containing protein [bacterium]
MEIPEPDEIAKSLNQLAWDHLNKLAYCGTQEPDPSLNIDPEALIVFISIIAAKPRNRTHPRILHESLVWGRNLNNFLSKSRYKSVLQSFDVKEGDQEWPRVNQFKNFIFEETNHLSELSINFQEDDLREYDQQEIEKSVRSNNRIFLRTLLGNIKRAEVVNFLSHGRDGNSHEISRKVLVDQPLVHRFLKDLKTTGLISTEQDGRQIINSWKGWDIGPNPKEKWRDWPGIYQDLLEIQKKSIVPKADDLTEYQRNHIKGQIKKVIEETEKSTKISLSRLKYLPESLFEPVEEANSDPEEEFGNIPDVNS